ncbi:MAG: hypothetical protein H6737_25460 [Alphaproteobacteria bacterium]|nr:hypothetical protein [Alphaproteobacteria bacterium]
MTSTYAPERLLAAGLQVLPGHVAYRQWTTVFVLAVTSLLLSSVWHFAPAIGALAAVVASGTWAAAAVRLAIRSHGVAIRRFAPAELIRCLAGLMLCIASPQIALMPLRFVMHLPFRHLEPIGPYGVVALVGFGAGTMFALSNYIAGRAISLDFVSDGSASTRGLRLPQR